MKRSFPASCYISVDVETAGPNPSQYSLLAIGACTLPEEDGNPPATFYVELQPVNMKQIPAAYTAHRLSLETLAAQGLPPGEALHRFEAWLAGVVPEGSRPVFTAFNAPFDWMFVNDYFIRYLGHNPFGHTALDIKAFYLGLAGGSWAETSWARISSCYQLPPTLTHHALQDAIDQGRAFQRMLIEAKTTYMGEK